MKRFLARVGRFFWSRVFLKVVLWTITLIVLFYVEEDWRGARAWAATKAKWEAQGETFDIMRHAPKPVPDAENLAALSLFKMELDPDPDPQRHGYLAPLTLRKAFHWDWEHSDLPRGGNWELGQLADPEKNRKFVDDAYPTAQGNASHADTFAQFSTLVPAVADLRAAAAGHPLCQFDPIYYCDFSGAASSVNLLTSQIMLSKFLTADAVLALDAKKPDIALADIRVHTQLLSGASREPLLVAGLVSIGMEAINLSAIYQGLATHAWNDEQLGQLQTQLAPIDFLASYQNGMRGEPCITIAILDRLKTQRARLVSELNPQAVTNPPTPPNPRNLTPFHWRDGWLDSMMSHAADFDLEAARLVDLPNRILSPQKVSQFATDRENHKPLLNYNDPRPITSAAQKFAIAQVRLDETRIAIALERYHLAHGAYPATLDELAPACIDAAPHDIIDGKPFHYQARADGTFQLYSVGWNGTDDGGNFAFKKENSKAIDYEIGDWVWPHPKVSP